MSIFLTILKILGIALLALLVLVLVLLLVLLFVPIRYEGHLLYRDYAAAEVQVSWLLRMIRLQADFRPDRKDKLRWNVFLFGREILSGQKQEADGISPVTEEPGDTENSPRPEPGEQDSGEAAPGSGTKPPAAEEPETTAKPGAAEAEEAAVKPGMPEAPEAPAKPSQSGAAAEAPDEDTVKVPEEEEVLSPGERLGRWISKLPEEILAKLAEWQKKAGEQWESIAGGLQKLNDKIEQVRDLLEDEDNQKAMELLWRSVKILVRHILPTKVRGELLFGLGDPASTGWVLSWIAMILPLNAEDLRVTPDFEDIVLDADVECKGRLFLSVPAGLLLRLLLDRKVWKLYREAKACLRTT